MIVILQDIVRSTEETGNLTSKEEKYLFNSFTGSQKSHSVYQGIGNVRMLRDKTKS